MPNLHAVVLSWSVQLEPLPSVRKVRWLLDVDSIDATKKALRKSPSFHLRRIDQSIPRARMMPANLPVWVQSPLNAFFLQAAADPRLAVVA